MDPRVAFEKLRGRVSRLRFSQTTVIIGSILLEAAAIAIAALALLVLMQIFVSPPPAVHVALLVVVVGAAVAAIAVRALRAVRAIPSAVGIAHRFENARPGIEEGAVRSALSLWEKRDDERHGYSRGLIDAHITETAERADGRATGVVRKRSLFTAAAAFAALFVLASAGWLAAPEATSRALARIAVGGVTPAPTIEVSPGDVSVTHGQDLVVRASIDPPPNREPALLVRDAGSSEQRLAMKAVVGARGQYESVLKGVVRDLAYQVQDLNGAWQSPLYRVSVARAPMLLSFEKRYAFPAYTGMPERVVEEGDGHLKALRGTQVALTLKSGGPMSRGLIRMNSGQQIVLEIGATGSANVATAMLTIGNPDRYQVSLWDTQGNPAEVSPIFDIEPVADEAPIVTLINPASDTTMSREMMLDVAAGAIDDFGISKMSLVFTKGDEGETRVPMFQGRGGIELDKEFVWDLSEIELLPGEAITYFVEAWDNDGVLGAKRGQSRTLSIRFPTLAEIYDEVDEEETGQTETLTEAFESSMDLKERVESMVRDLKREKESTTSWQKKEELENILKEQEEVAEELGRVAEELDQTMEKLERNNLVNPEVLEKLAEIRKLVEEVATDEMKAAMQKLREAMQKLDPKEIADAAKNLSMTQEEFLKKLDRTIEMLKSAQNERKLEEAAKSLEQLAQKQEELEQKTNEATPDKMKEMSAEQDALKKETEDAIKKMDELANDMEAQEPGASEGIKKSSDGLKEEQAPQEMNEASKSMSSGKKSPAMKSQSKAKSSLKKAAEGMKEALAQMKSRDQEEARAAIEKGIRDLIYLSKAEESLVGRVEKTAERMKSAPRDLARRQSDLKRGIDTVAGEIEEATKKTMHIGPSVPELLRRAGESARESEEALSSGNVRVGGMLGNRAMVGVNAGLVKLLEAQNSLESSCNNPSANPSGSCENPGLSGMSQSQGQINQGAQQLGEQMGQGQRLSQSDEQRLSQLAAEQEAVRQGLEEFAGQMGESQGVLGRLDKIAEEMNEMERELEERRPGDAAKRGEKIMQRLLDADRALKRQGFKKERTSETARSGAGGASPSAISDMLEKADTKVREDILRTLSVRYPGEYEALIRAYFDALQKDGAK
ncbi:MAG: DUF4175 family protein [bacterium]